MTRLLFNEDLNHFIYTRAINDIGMSEAKRFFPYIRPV